MAAPVVLSAPHGHGPTWDVGIPPNIPLDLWLQWHAARGLLGSFCPWPWRLGWQEHMAIAVNEPPVTVSAVASPHMGVPVYD